MFRMLYKGLVRPHLETSVAVWSPHTVELINAIDSVQRRATRMVPGFKELPYEERNRRLDLPSMRYRRLRMDCIEAYKILNHQYDTDCTPTLLLKENQTRNRGNGKSLIIKRARTELRRNSFTHRIAPLWNSLPETVVSSPTVDTFKARMDKYWIKKAIYYSHEATVTGVICKGVLNPRTEEES